jgi:hypothetical protein
MAKLPEDSRKRNAKRLSKEDICLPFIGHGLRVANLASTSSSYSGPVTGRDQVETWQYLLQMLYEKLMHKIL